MEPHALTQWEDHKSESSLKSTQWGPISPNNNYVQILVKEELGYFKFSQGLGGEADIGNCLFIYVLLCIFGNSFKQQIILIIE